jgi:hypothetical protein
MCGADFAVAQSSAASLHGTVTDTTGAVLGAATIELKSLATSPTEQTVTDPNGHFIFSSLPPGRYRLTVQWGGNGTASTIVLIRPGDQAAAIHVLAGRRQFRLRVDESILLSGGTQNGSQENVGSRQVSQMPLEQRDSTTLLLLASGINTTTGTGGNFTQQYSVHGQKGTTAVFALDGADTTDPELGGATISDFNVDAIQTIDSASGVLPASIGEGAAGYTDILSKSGTNQMHGVAYEFLRNSVLDARNYFDVISPVHPKRIPPFIRNEFGLTNGGPVVLPRLYDGRNRTFYMVEYQGLRQIQGTTQVLSVPTLAERAGQDTTAFPGDTLTVPINPQIQSLLNLYPVPNDPTGAYGARTYATNSKVETTSDQFSIRIDQKVSDTAQIMGRFTLENIVGPTTNPDQTAINPTYAQVFTEGYRSATLRYTRTPSARFTMTTQVSVIRSTPLYSSLNQVQPGLTFSDNLYEAINSQAGGTRGTWGNLLQARQTFAEVRGAHVFEIGGEVRINRDTSAVGFSTDGTYSFGGGAVYSPVNIVSASGQHNINAGQILPDGLSAFLTATPFSYSKTVGGRGFPQGTRIGEAGIHREAYNLYFLDNWRVTPGLSLGYGLRYEVNTRLREPHDMTQGPLFFATDGKQQVYPSAGATQEWVVNPDPSWNMDWNGWGPRASLSWQASKNSLVHAAGGITTVLPFPFPNTNNMNSFPFAVTTAASATPGAPIPFNNANTSFVPPPVYTPQGAPVYRPGSTLVPGNTGIDVVRFEQDLAAQLPGNTIQPVQGNGQLRNFGNGYLATYEAGIQQELRGFSVSASYIGIVGVRIQGQSYPNAYIGASPGFAPFAQFNDSGQFLGGFGQESIFNNFTHSSYNAGEFIVRKAPTKWGIGLNLSYTLSHAIDNFPGGGGGSSSVRQGGPPQDPTQPNVEKGISLQNVSQNLSFTLSADLHVERLVSQQGPLHVLASGWGASGIGKFSSGPPFSVYSGVQQTGYGNGGGDRPDQVGLPALSTKGPVKNDYFGRGAANNSFFLIPINVPNGTGPFSGRPGTLGRNTFQGPPLKDIDLAIWKDSELWKATSLEFRAEFYNLFNIVSFGLPNNVVTGSGFGIINATAPNDNSRQLQFSLKWMY